jgi:ubiquinone biosynthesis monooxygenase Coq7
MKQLRVFFDGSCPMCRKEISIYQRADKSQNIEWFDVSIEQHGSAAAADPLPLPRQALLARFHVQTPNGELISGARGFIAMWRQLPKWRWAAFACSVPGIPTILEVAYRGFLKIRPAVQRALR